MAEKKDYLFTPIKTKTCDVQNEINTTLVNTPMPQASSTVQRKPTYVFECFYFYVFLYKFSSFVHQILTDSHDLAASSLALAMHVFIY